MIPRTPSRNIILNEGDVETKRREITEYFVNTWELYEELFTTLCDERAFFEKAIPLRHPLIFYYGHTAVFYINKLALAGQLEERLNPELESLMSIGVDEMSWDELKPDNYEWPSLESVQAYRDTAKALIIRLIDTMNFTMPINWDSPMWIILMGIEHERIHLETSSVLIRQLPLAYVKPHPSWPHCGQMGTAPANNLIPVEGGTVSFGKARNHQLYGWDNEYGEHRVEVKSFAASQFLVSNGEYGDFVRAGGYSDRRWWGQEGWQWVSSGITHPTFWVADGDGWKLRIMLAEIPMPANWPVEVNQFEASAFCRWLSQERGELIRLPSEDEWYRMRDLSEIPDEPHWTKAPGNINLEHYCSSVPVDSFAFGSLYDVLGNVWQWTLTPIDGFDGFKVHPIYDDFSTPTFDQQHFLMKGGSWISTGNEAGYHARYAFRPYFFQHAGFRYIKGEKSEVAKGHYFESDPELARFCEFNYGQPCSELPSYGEQIVRYCLNKMQGKPMRKALDLGCTVGRTSFELARYFDHVTGLDFSARLMRLGIQMQETGSIRYKRLIEGNITEDICRRAVELDLQDLSRKITFLQGDACNLKSRITDYDLILAGNLLDRIYDPALFLSTINERLNPGGMLVIASAYAWDEANTPVDKWLGGTDGDGNCQSSFQAMSIILEKHFRRVEPPEELRYAVRETARTALHCVAQCSTWERLD